MSQTFNLCIATDTIVNDSKQLGVTVDDLKRICIHVHAEIVRQPALQLQLTYQVTLPIPFLAAQFNWPIWQAAQVGFFDYLWEETCLECFITGSLVSDDDTATADSTASYIEINANPDGRYALYQFESYRNPATLPPIPLYQADGHTRIRIYWTDNLAQQRAEVGTALSSKLSTASEIYTYERRFGVPLIQLPNQQYAIKNTVIERIHPCVILWFGETALYFAPRHASPPDFHNRCYWSKFKL